MRPLCIHNNATAMRNATPSGTPIPAPIATSLLEEEEGQVEGAEESVAAAAVTVTVAVAVLLGDVEPDVRLKITWPALRGKGVLLPFVGRRQVLLMGSGWLQQKRNWLFRTPKGKRVAPLSGTT